MPVSNGEKYVTWKWVVGLLILTLSVGLGGAAKAGALDSKIDTHETRLSCVEADLKAIRQLLMETRADVAVMKSIIEREYGIPND